MSKANSTSKAQTTAQNVADAVDGNWVDRRAPVRLRPLLRLSRLDRPIGTWLLLIPCLWGLGLAMLHSGTVQLGDAWILFVCTIGSVLMRGAGCTWNDFTDRDFDGAVERTRNRPLPSGQITPKGALLWMGAQAAVAFALLLTLNKAAIYLGLLSLIPVLIYPFAKRFTYWPQAFLGVAFNWGALLAFAAHSGSLAAPAAFAFACGIAWTLFYDTIYAHQDVEDDALIGVKSTARLFGDQSPKYLRGFQWAATALMALAVVTAADLGGAAALALCGVAGFWAHMRWQMGQLVLDDSARLLRLFRSNRDAGLIPALFFAASAML